MPESGRTIAAIQAPSTAKVRSLFDYGRLTGLCLRPLRTRCSPISPGR